MENKINITELLKDCPSGMELNCLMYEDVYFDYVDELNNIHCYIQQEFNKTSVIFNQDGTPTSHTKSKCVIFPKYKTTWEGFVPPCEFKDGDIYYIKDVFGLEFVSIIKKCENNKLYTYVDIGISTKSFYCDESEGLCYCKDIIEHRPATKDEKEKLFKEIKDNGYHWSPETKTLEEFVKPKFKVGDRIRSIISNSGYIYNVIEVKESLYVVSKNNEYDNKLIDFKIQDYWELIPNKFDITTLKPFDRVLMRSSNTREWVATFYSNYSNNKFYGCGMCCDQCIPYEGNEHLRGTTNDCDEYYKNW